MSRPTANGLPFPGIRVDVGRSTKSPCPMLEPGQPHAAIPILTLFHIGPGGKFHPRYSPDGRHLAFTVDFDGSEAFHLFVHDFATGEQRDLTPDIEMFPAG